MPAPRHARPAPRPRSACRGLTAIEMAVTLGVAAVLLGTAVPAFQDFRLRREVEAVAAQLETDLQLARAEAVARNEDVRVSFASGAGGSCYVVHAGPAGSCRCTAGGAVDCSPGDEALRVARRRTAGDRAGPAAVAQRQHPVRPREGNGDADHHRACRRGGG